MAMHVHMHLAIHTYSIVVYMHLAMYTYSRVMHLVISLSSINTRSKFSARSRSMRRR